MKLFVIVIVALLAVTAVDAKKKFKREVDPNAKQPFKFRNLKATHGAIPDLGLPTFKTPEPYELCKLKCKEERDAIAITDYVQQLRDELAVAELVEAQFAADQAAAPAEAEFIDHAAVEAIPEETILHETNDVIRETASQLKTN